MPRECPISGTPSDTVEVHFASKRRRLKRRQVPRQEYDLKGIRVHTIRAMFDQLRHYRKTQVRPIRRRHRIDIDNNGRGGIGLVSTDKERTENPPVSLKVLIKYVHYSVFRPLKCKDCGVLGGNRIQGRVEAKFSINYLDV